MRPITIILIVVSLLLGFGAVFLGKRYIQRSAAEAAAKQEELKRDVEVLVAAKDMFQGVKVKEDDLEWVNWPNATALGAKAVVREKGKDKLEHLSGSVLRRNVVAGEPITDKTVFKPGKSGVMPGMISPGKKAVGITVTAASTASGFVLPGDMVDVLLVMEIEFPGAKKKSKRFATETILTNVRVLAVNQEFTSGAESSAKSTTKKSKKKEKEKDKDKAKEGEAPVGDTSMVGKTVAIEVTPEQAEIVLTAQKGGSLSLSLRSLAEGDGDEVREKPYVMDFELSKALMSTKDGARIIRGGQVSGE